MNCKACGEPIPSHLLRQDSFRCPKCGRAYYRGSKPTKAASTSKAAPEKRTARKSAGAGLKGFKPPKWLLSAIAALLILAIAVGGVWLLRKRGFGGSGVSGAVKVEGLAVNKNQSITIEIPRQRGNYMVATESSQIGVVCSVNEKTDTSFDLVVRNLYTKDRNPTISWVLVPCKAPVE